MSERDEDLPVLLTPAAVANLLGVSERTLKNLRYYGGGPDWVKIGERLVRYRAEDVLEYLERRKRDRT